MRRFVTLAILLLFTIPFGVSISGCSKKSPTIFCNGGDNGIPVGQVTTITLSPQIFGISLNFAQIGQVSAPVATDCKGTTESVSSYTYGTFLANGTPDITIADVQPTTGKLCAGTWNRNTGGGIPDFTTCTPTNKSGTVFVIASGAGASSNPLPIFVHPVVTSVVLGPPSTDCINDPATNCSPAAFTTQTTRCTTDPGTGCCTTPVTSGAATASLNSCASQGTTGQLAARVYQNSSTALANNISCKVGHLSYVAQTPSVVTIDQNGVATAQQPGSTVITANIANAGSSAGFFSTCPPKSIALSVPGISGSSSSIVVNPNNTQPITSLVLDTNGHVLTGLTLEFESTTPTTIPAAAAGTVTPLFPGAAAITAVCQPPSCNPSPFNQIGLFGNGKPVTSNPVTVTAPGTNSTNLYIASTNSLYLVPVDFTQPQIGAPVRLPYQPNSMVISNDGSTIYMGSSFELMTFNAVSNSISAQDTTVTGPVLAVSPDGTTLVITDPIRQFVYLYNASGTGGTTTTGGTSGTGGTTTATGIQTQFGGVGTRAVFSPDSQTVYITLGDYNPSTGVVTPNNQLLVHSQFTGWYQTTSSQPTTDVALGVPYVGAFFGGNPTTARSYCPVTTTSSGTASTSSTTTNLFYPDAGVIAPAADRIATTNDGLHVLGATTASFTDLAIPSGLPIGNCPLTDATPVKFTTTVAFTGALPGVTATAITGVFPTSDSKTSFVTYTGTGGVVPTYTPATPQPSSTPGGAPTVGPGALGSIALSTALGTPVAPVAGVVSADNLTFYAGTSGDNAVHLITRQPDGSYKDVTTPIAPKLPDVNGNIVAPNLLVQKPRKSTN
jgi:trimeric autotransporter adhesin